MNDFAEQRLEANAWTGIKQFLKDFRVPASEGRLAHAVGSYSIDNRITGDGLRWLNRRFLAYLTDFPEEAIRRYITEEAPKTLAKDGAVKEEFSEERSKAVICRLLHERGIERDHDEIRASAVKQLRMRPSLKNLQGVYETFEQELERNPIHEYPRLFGRRVA